MACRLHTSLVLSVAEVITELLNAPIVSRILRHLLEQDNVLPLETGKSFHFYHAARALADKFWPLKLLHFT